MKNNGQVDWAAVRHAFYAGNQTVAGICRQHGISPSRLYARRKQEQWPPRDRMPAAGLKTPKHIHKTKIERLYSLLDRLMKEIEMEPLGAAKEVGVMKSGTADRERSARTLSSLIRSFEKIKELEAEERSEAQGTDDDINEADEKEAEELRKALLERFSKLTEPNGNQNLS